MALADIFRTRKSNRIHGQVWQIIWDGVKTPPTGEGAARELHAVFVGTLLYATRYQAAVAAGMGQNLARTVALDVVAQANFDEQMRDKVLSVFPSSHESRSSGYAERLNVLVVAVVHCTQTGGRAPGGKSVEALLKEVEHLRPVLAEQLSARCP